jgi:serine/threonine protein kinase
MLPGNENDHIPGTRWKITKKLGSGMIGNTYLVGEQASIIENTGQLLVAKVAIKENLGQKAIESVRNEATRLKSLHIDRIPQFHDLEETDEALILLQTFLPGRTLREHLNNDSR